MSIAIMSNTHFCHYVITIEGYCPHIVVTLHYVFPTVVGTIIAIRSTSQKLHNVVAIEGYGQFQLCIYRL